MLTKADIEFIKRNRAEITRNRTVSVKLIHENIVIGEDQFTGSPIYGTEEEIVDSTWTSLTSQSGGEGELVFVNGVQAETDDVIANIDIQYDLSDVKKIIHVDTDVEYRIKARDQIGLGENNRHYLLLKKVL